MSTHNGAAAIVFARAEAVVLIVIERAPMELTGKRRRNSSKPDHPDVELRAPPRVGHAVHLSGNSAT